MKLGMGSLTRLTVFLATSLSGLTGCAPPQAVAPEIETVIVAHPRLYLDKPAGDALGDLVKAGDRMVLNGPLFGDDGDPVGGYLTRVTHGFNAPGAQAAVFTRSLAPAGGDADNFNWHNQIFGQRADGSFFMKPYESWLEIEGLVKREQAVFLIQNGPALVVNGTNIHKAESSHRATRIGIGYTADNRLIVADSQGLVNMYDLAEALLDRGAFNAVYLDGNRNGWIMDGRERGTLPRNATLLHVH